VLQCVECGTRSLSATGWRGVRVDLPDEGDEPALAFYCPECAQREFGDR
jgi:ribosomal protein L44E